MKNVFLTATAFATLLLGLNACSKKSELINNTSHLVGVWRFDSARWSNGTVQNFHIEEPVPMYRVFTEDSVNWASHGTLYGDSAAVYSYTLTNDSVLTWDASYYVIVKVTGNQLVWSDYSSATDRTEWIKYYFTKQ